MYITRPAPPPTGVSRSRDPKLIFDQIFDKLKAAKLMVRDTYNWYDQMYIAQYNYWNKLQPGMEELLEFCEKAKNVNQQTGGELLDENRIINLYTFLYETIIACGIKVLGAHYEAADDAYSRTPLVNIFMLMMVCVNFLFAFFPDSVSPMYFQRPSHNEYCSDLGLAVVDQKRISQFTVKDWFASIMEIEHQLHDLFYSAELVSYVDALEIRLSQLLLHSWRADVHDDPKRRMPRGTRTGSSAADLKTQQYVFMTSAEYEFIVMMLSVRIDIATAVANLRGPEMFEYTEVEKVLAEKVRSSFIRECLALHGSDMEDKFRPVFQRASIETWEYYLYAKRSPGHVDPEPKDVITAFPDHQLRWSQIQTTANLPLIEFLSNPDANFLGFKLVFFFLMEQLVAKKLSQEWTYFAVDGMAVSAMSAGQLQEFQMNTMTTPMFVITFNDACVYNRGVMYMFGHHAIDYFRAVVFWMKCAVHDHDGSVGFSKRTKIAPLIQELLGRPYLDDDSQQSTDVSLPGASSSHQEESVLGDSFMANLHDLVGSTEDREERRAEARENHERVVKQVESIIPTTIKLMPPDFFMDLFNNRLESTENFNLIMTSMVRDINCEYDVDRAHLETAGSGLMASHKSAWE